MCGIAGAYRLNHDEPSREPVLAVNMMLTRLQNRGDLSTGITRYNPKGLNMLEVRRGRGTVKEFFGGQGSYQNEQFLKSFVSTAAIGHNRYATSGQTDDEEAIRNYAHPYLFEHNRKWKEFSFAFNGNIINEEAIKKSILRKDENYYFKTDTDTELIKIYLAMALNRVNRKTHKADFVRIFRIFARLFDGAYNLVFLDGNGHFIALRDPLGFHPLHYAQRGDMVLVSSEDSAIRALGMDDVHEVPPGYMLYCDGKQVELIQYAASKRKAYCIFEFVYFMNAASTMGGRLVQKARGALGHALAQDEPIEFENKYVTAPVPGTAIGMCDGYQLGVFESRQHFLPRYDALVKVNEARSFLADFGYYSRDQVIRNKFDLTPGYLRGKELILVDDSIVRGSTSRQLIRYLRKETKARKIHMRVAAAPSRFPCFYGINMPTLEELIASNGKTTEAIAREIGADSLRYNTVEAMIKAVQGSVKGLKPEHFCTGCFTGEYPTAGGNAQLKALLKKNAVPHATKSKRQKTKLVK